MGFNIRTFEELTQKMILFIKGNTEKLTNFKIGSKTRTLIEAVAIVMEELYKNTYNMLKKLIEEAIYVAFNFSRLPAKKATGIVRFTRNSQATADYTIPKGTIVQTAATDSIPAIKFVTTETVALLTGNTYIEAQIEALEAGSIGNVDANTITKFVAKPAGIDSVTNPEALTNGRDLETNDERKKRFREYFESNFRATKTALEYGAKEVDGVKDAKIVETPFIYAIIDDLGNFIDISNYANDPYEVSADLFPAVEAVDNCLYLGASNKFNFIYTHLSTLGIGSGGVWEYFNGSTWTAITDVVDETNGFTSSGVIKFSKPSDWKDTKIADIWAFFIRFRITEANYTQTPQIGHLFAAPPPGIVELYVHDGDGNASDTLLNSVKDNIEKYRGSGITINIKAPTKILLQIQCNIKVNTILYDKNIIKDMAKEKIISYLNTLKLGENLIITILKREITSIENGDAIEYVEMVTPVDNVLVSGEEIIRPDESNINVVVMN